VTAMQKITKDAAERAIEKLYLGDKNRAFAGYWLSLWQGDALPRIECFDAAQLRDFAPGLMTFAVVPERHVEVQWAGSDVLLAVGKPLSGTDWIKAVPVRNQALRMRNM